MRTGPHGSFNVIFPYSAPLPTYIVLMESTRPVKNSDKYDQLALAECINLVIRGAKTIFYNGINQVKIQCEDREDANTLVRWQELMRGGFRLFIPSSLIWGPIDLKYPAADIVDRIELALLEVIVAVRRRTNKDGSTSAKGVHYSCSPSPSQSPSAGIVLPADPGHSAAEEVFHMSAITTYI